jgi:hypothetical protein
LPIRLGTYNRHQVLEFLLALALELVLASVLELVLEFLLGSALMLATVLVALTLLHFVPEIVAEKAEVVESSSAAMSEPIRAARFEPALT